MDEKFWMVWNRNGNMPRCTHASRKSAEEEAKRLARNNPVQEFVVLEALLVVSTGEMPVSTRTLKTPKRRKNTDDQIPF